MEILGRFVHECINWLENAEKEEKAGNISDDRFGKGVRNVSPLYTLVGFLTSYRPFFRLHSYVDFITPSSSYRSWTQHAMQIPPKWRISVFAMLVLKKQIHFTGLLRLPDFEESFASSKKKLTTNDDSER